MKIVRYYTTNPTNGGTMFKCVFCEHTVATQDFNQKEGNRRTQAAAAMNQHAAALHRSNVCAPAAAKLGGRGAL